MSRHAFGKTAMALLLCAAAATVLDARVFMRRGGGEKHHVDSEQIGWPSAAADSTVLINGRPSTVQVFAAPVSGPHALGRLRAVYEGRGADVAVFPDAEVGWGLAAWPDRVTKFLVLSPRELTHSIVYLLHTRADDQAAAAAAPLPGVPDYPGARAGVTVAHTGAGVASRFLHTQAFAGEVLAFYDSALGGEGWTPFFTDAHGARAGGPLAVYVQGDRMCFVNVTVAPGAVPERVVTLLVKDRVEKESLH